jgi:hypothetical protein
MQRKAREQCRGGRLVVLCARAGERLGRQQVLLREGQRRRTFVRASTLSQLGYRHIARAGNEDGIKR